MFHKMVIFLVFIALPSLADDLLVLKNGKRFKIDSSYELKGQFVVFKQNGQLQQLPLKIVDLEKSKQATADLRAKEEAELKAKAPKPKEKDTAKYSSMSEIAEFVETNRTKDNPRKEGVSISSDRLDKYSSNNPSLKNTSAEFSMEIDEEHTASARAATRDELGQSYLKVKADVKELDLRISEAEDYAQLLASESAFGDEPTGKFHKKMEDADEKVEILKKDRESKLKEMKELEKEARKNGIRDIKRYKAPKDKKNENN